MSNKKQGSLLPRVQSHCLFFFVCLFYLFILSLSWLVECLYVCCMLPSVDAASSPTHASLIFLLHCPPDQIWHSVQSTAVPTDQPTDSTEPAFLTGPHTQPALPLLPFISNDIEGVLSAFWGWGWLGGCGLRSWWGGRQLHLGLMKSRWDRFAEPHGLMSCPRPFWCLPVSPHPVKTSLRALRKVEG